MQVIFATNAEGQHIPVIDVTNPAFFVTVSDEELSKIAARTLKIAETAIKMRKSNISDVQPSSSLSYDEKSAYYGGMITYFNKLGVENLHDAFAAAHDRNMAGTIAPIAMRLRLRAIAQYLADNLEILLAPPPLRGPPPFEYRWRHREYDSWNGLIYSTKRNRNCFAREKRLLNSLISTRSRLPLGFGRSKRSRLRTRRWQTFL